MQARSSHDDQPAASGAPATTTTTTPADAWSARASAAFGPLVDAAPRLVTDARKWVSGELSADDFRERVTRTGEAFKTARARVDALPPSPGDPEARQLYRVSAALYDEIVPVYATALDTGPGDLRNQLDLLARRIRELGDRTFDVGHDLLLPGAQGPAGVDVRRPEEVPLWVAEGLAAGPPLDAAPPPPDQFPPLRQDARPETAQDAWIASVAASGAPPASELAAAIDAGDAARLADVARRFVAAAEKLRAEPDPAGHRADSARTRLALLVYADAARATQAGVVPVARALVTAADDLWSPLLPPRQ